MKYFAKFSLSWSHHHGQLVRPLDPILFSATTVWHRGIALPSLSCGHDRVAETSRADHYRASCCHHRIASPAPTSDGSGWLLRLRGGKKWKPSHCVFITKSRLLSSSTSPLLFVLPPASFWPNRHQPISIVCFAPCRASYPSVFVNNLQKKLGRRSGEELNLCVVKHGSILGVVGVALLDISRNVPLHHRQNLSSLSFSCAHSSPTSS
jgi:hypothetical protein